MWVFVCLFVYFCFLVDARICQRGFPCAQPAVVLLCLQASLSARMDASPTLPEPSEDSEISPGDDSGAGADS